MDGKTSFRKAWEVLFPYLLYYLAYNAALLIVSFLVQLTMQKGNEAYTDFVTAHIATITGAAGGLCMIAGILPLLSMLKRELHIQAQDGAAQGARVESVARLPAIVILAVSVSLGLNALLTLTGFAESSQTYQEVADHQYGVAFGVGLVLYGLISPFTEEVLFRGVIYNRLRRLFGPLVGIVSSGVLFGAFHGNLVQGVYGTVMGIFIAYLYERSRKFYIPILFHAVANLAVYTTAYVPAVQETLFTPAGCAILLTAAVGAVCLERRR